MAEVDALLDGMRETLQSVEQRLEKLTAIINDSRDLERLDDQLHDVREGLVELKTTLNGWLSRSADGRAIDAQFETVATKLEKLGDVHKSVESVDKKTLPLAQTYAVAAALLVFLGLSFVDLRSTSSRITNLQKPLDEAADHVRDVADKTEQRFSKIDEALSKLESDYGKLQASQDQHLKQMSEFAENATKKIDGVQVAVQQVEPKLRLLDGAIAGIVSRANAFEALDKGRSKFGAEQGKGDGELTGLRTLADILGNDLPESSIWHLEVSEAMDKGDYAKARDVALRAKARDKNTAEGVYDLIIGQAYLREGDNLKAIEALKEALRREPTLAAAEHTLSSCYFRLIDEAKSEAERQENLRLATEYEEKAAEKRPKVPAVIGDLSIVYNKAGRYQDSLKLLSEFSGEDETGLIAYQLAATHALLGNKTAAIDGLAKAIQINRKRAVMAVGDADFTALQSDPAFETLIEKAVGAPAYQVLKAAAVKSKEGKEPAPDK